jgi:tetratricopeptide (TPR) repeat protein
MGERGCWAVLGPAGAFLCVFWAVLGNFAACSSAPPAPDAVFEKRNQASRNLESGNRHFREARYAEALEFYALALDGYTAMDDSEGRVTALNSIGKVFFLSGDVPARAGGVGNTERAFSSYREAYSLAKRLESPRFVLQSANNLAEVHIRRGENAAALELLEDTLGQRGVRDFSSLELAVLYHNTALVLRNLERYGEALEAAMRARDMNRGAKRFGELASNYYIMSSIYFRQGVLGEARGAAGSALEYDKRMENSLGIAEDLLALGSIEEKGGDVSAAYDMYKRAFLVYRSLKYAAGLSRALEKLFLAAENLNLREEAESYREAYEQLQKPAP